MAARVFWVGLALITLATIAAGISFCGWLLFQAARSDGKVDYCFVKQVEGITSNEFDVYGHRPWRTDEKIATFKSLLDAETWRSQKCPR